MKPWETVQFSREGEGKEPGMELFKILYKIAFRFCV
jgi:hypothetical protein